MRFKIPCNKGNKFYILLNILKFFPPYNKLTEREAEVFAELLYYNDVLNYIDEKKRMKLVFDYDTRSEIATKLKISTDSIYNIVSSLKRKGFLTGKSFTMKYVLPNVDMLIFEFQDDTPSI